MTVAFFACFFFLFVGKKKKKVLVNRIKAKSQMPGAHHASCIMAQATQAQAVQLLLAPTVYGVRKFPIHTPRMCLHIFGLIPPLFCLFVLFYGTTDFSRKSRL
jgi:hypothetical protein